MVLKEIYLANASHNAEEMPTLLQDTASVKKNTILWMEIVKNVKKTQFTTIKRKSVNLFVVTMQPTTKLTENVIVIRITMCYLMEKKNIVGNAHLMKIMMGVL